MIPLVFLFLLIEQLGRKTLSMIHLDRPFFSAELSPANLINWVFLAAIVIGLALSLCSPRSKA
jgi:predicted branched-subunit amino acid permease